MAIDPALLARLDPQTQASLTGGKYTTNKGTTSTYNAGATPGTVAGLRAEMTNIADQGSYQAAADTFAAGGNTNTAAAAYQGGQALTNNVYTAPPGFSTDQRAQLSDMISAGAQVVGGYVIDPTTGMAVGRAPTTGTTAGTMTTTNTPTPTGTGGGGGGGGGGGTTPTPPETPGNEGGLGQVSREAITAQIDALTAQYGLDLASLAALGGEIGRQAKFLMSQLQRDQEFAQEDLLGSLVSRGVLRSGITGRDVGRLQGDFARQRAQVELDKGQRLRQLAERAGAASAALGRGKADVIGEIDQGNLPAEIRQALLGELNSLTPADIQAALDAAYSGNQQSLTDLMQKGGGQTGLSFDPNQVQQIVGGYAIDPNTGLATGSGGLTAPEPQPAARQGIPGLTPQQIEMLLGPEYTSDMGMYGANNRALTGLAAG